jgi:hypothetical protein
MDFSGFDVIVGVGGDGTFHECLNGMMKRSAAKGKQPAPLALIAARTGNSFMHEAPPLQAQVGRLSHPPGRQLPDRHLPAHLWRWLDVLLVQLDPLGHRLRDHAHRRAPAVDGQCHALHTTACFIEIVGGEKAQLAKVVVTDENDKEVEYNDKFIVAIITASRGMKMAPEAKIDDGLVS